VINSYTKYVISFFFPYLILIWAKFRRTRNRTVISIPFRVARQIYSPSLANGMVVTDQILPCYSPATPRQFRLMLAFWHFLLSGQPLKKRIYFSYFCVLIHPFLLFLFFFIFAFFREKIAFWFPTPFFILIILFFYRVINSIIRGKLDSHFSNTVGVFFFRFCCCGKNEVRSLISIDFTINEHWLFSTRLECLLCIVQRK